jgi:hypothetical protein
MKYFRQGSFYYGQRKDGKYTQVCTFNGLSTPTLSVVSKGSALFTDTQEIENIEITGTEFKVELCKAVALIAGFEICSEPEIKTDELNESDVQKEN